MACALQSALQIICEANGLKLEDVQSGNSASKVRNACPMSIEFEPRVMLRFLLHVPQVEALEIFLTPLERYVLCILDDCERFSRLKRKQGPVV